VPGLSEARKVQFILEASHIPSCLGPDNLENADAFEPGFEGEVDVKVCDFHLGRAQKVLDQYLPEQKEPEVPDDTDFTAHCPKCHSTEIVFQATDEEPADDADSSPKSGWSCDACGHQWNDDDIEAEA
jgi:DNA-directed RNA polymerase subunit M/transcription elongation factor TFIIS